VALADGEAALSSGNYERYFQTPAGRAHHILDPATGRPSQGTAGVTVIARDAAWGNAAAVALMVGGRESFAALARALAVDCALLVTEDGERLLTPGMRQRLQAPQPDGT
jgi:thiamine biosynthesis lipoprotein